MYFKSFVALLVICFVSAVLILLSIILIAPAVIAQCQPPTPPLPPGPPNCAYYRDGWFVNDNSNCQAWFHCANANAQPRPGLCPLPYNFDEEKQMCSHPLVYPCPDVCADEDDFINVAVREHNHYRGLHNTPNVIAVPELNQVAQQWAEHLATTNTFQHSNSGYGENLFRSWGGITDRDVIVANAIGAFYREIQHYDWNNPVFSAQTGHFTQVVWRASTEIGVGVAVRPDPTWRFSVTVCINYRPPGNWAGQFQQNVLPLTPIPFSRSSRTLNLTIIDDEANFYEVL